MFVSLFLFFFSFSFAFFFFFFFGALLAPDETGADGDGWDGTAAMYVSGWSRDMA